MAPIVKFPRASCWERNTPLYIFEGFPFREKTGKCIVRKMLLWEYFCVFINKAYVGFPGGSDGKESASIAADPSSIPESGRSLAEGNGYPFQCSCLENPMDRGAWWAIVHGVRASQTELRD